MALTPVDNYVLWESRVGGMPYLPLNEKYPTNSEGTPLKLLAQINFAQMPKLENYPEKGILQFLLVVMIYMVQISMIDKTKRTSESFIGRILLKTQTN